jgi:hypothetical protein
MPASRPPRRAIKIPAAQLVAWRLERQHLSGAAAVDPAVVARDLVGVQAQVLSSAALSIALRSSGTVEATTAALAERRLVRAWGMRSTLHLFDADDFPTIVAALGRGEPWRRPAWLRWFGMTELELEAAIEAVGEILDDGQARTRAELADVMGDRFGAPFAELIRGSWGSFLKLAANRGYLCQAWTGTPAVAFVRPDRWLPTWRREDSEDALRRLALRYVAAYGPASSAEIVRWWGLTESGMRPAVQSILGELTEVEVGGEGGYVRTVDLPAIEAATLPRGDAGVRLLGPFDPLTVTAGMRNQLLPPEHLKRVSRTAGWISPVLLVGGRAAGVWDSRRKGDRLVITIDLFDGLPPTARRALDGAAERVAAAQGATATVEFGPVFPVTTR